MSLAVNSKCLAFHGPLLYEAKILKLHKPDKDVIETKDESLPLDETFPSELQSSLAYFIHYKGWKSTWDEWVNEERVLSYTIENVRTQKELKAAALKASQSVSASKRKIDITDDTVNGKRRKNDDTLETEDEFLKRPEISMIIPDQLKALLVDDWELVTKEKQLVHLPANPNVKDILGEYKNVLLKQKRKGSAEFENALEMFHGLKLYFNRSLGSILLYQLERKQYASLLEKADDPSEVYGSEHLLRLLVSLPGLIAQTGMDQQAVAVLKEFLEDFLKYLDQNNARLFVKKYDNVSPSYEALSQS